MKTKHILIALLTAGSLYAAQIYTQNGLQVAILDDYRTAPIAIPVYLTFELQNISNEAIILPLDKQRDFTVLASDSSGNCLLQGGPTTNFSEGDYLLRLAPGQSYLYSILLNGVFGFRMHTPGTYSVQLLVEADGTYPSHTLVDGKWITRTAPCWKGKIITPPLKVTITEPPTMEDREIYQILSKISPVPDVHSYLPNREALFTTYAETMYAGLALKDGFFLKSDKYPTEASLVRAIMTKYPGAPIATILEYYIGNYTPATEYAKKIVECQRFLDTHKNTAWAAKTQRRIEWLQECIKDKTSDACKYPKQLF